MRTTMKLRTLVAALFLATAPLATQATTAVTAKDVDTTTAQLNTTAENKGQTQVATKIASSFTTLAGSDANSLKLVQALRNGTAATLTTVTGDTGTTGTGTTGTGTTSTGSTGGTTTTITPPTGKMGWGNVFISLALAKAVLANAGITNPTTAQLQAALNGGTITGADGKTVTLKGVLQMRADGMGWGQIAQASGTKLGPVVSSIKSAHTKVASLPTTATGAASGTSTTAAATGKSTTKGVTTANGTSATGSGNSTKGITTATGAVSAHGSKGLVTAGGTAAGSVTHGNSANAPGRGIVTAAGSGTGPVTAATGSGHGQGAGVVNAGGNAVGSGVTHGNSGNGNAGGNGKGKGGG